MVLEERNPEDNDRRRPRAFLHPHGSDGEDMVGEDGDGLEVDKDGEENSDEEEVEVPPHRCP